MIYKYVSVVWCVLYPSELCSSLCPTLGKQAIIHQVTTMLATSKNVHLLTTITDDPSLTLASTQAIIKVSGHQHHWLAGGYDLEIGHF